jgi:hypothetical protein
MRHRGLISFPIENPVWADVFFVAVLLLCLAMVFKVGLSAGWGFKKPWHQWTIGAIAILILSSVLIDLWYLLTGRGRFLH